jgi:predicted CoA-binding protein
MITEVKQLIAIANVLHLDCHTRTIGNRKAQVVWCQDKVVADAVFALLKADGFQEPSKNTVGMYIA